MQFTSEQRLDDGVLERGFTLGEIPGILWTTGPAPAPLILLGHPGGLHKMYPRLAARAGHSAAEGFAAATIAPRPGTPPCTPGHTHHRTRPHAPGRRDGAMQQTSSTASLDTEQAVDLARMFKALGDHIRLRLLSHITSAADGEICVCDITGGDSAAQL